MATRDYNTFYSTPGLWEIANPTHNNLEAAVGQANGRNANETLAEVIEWNATSPTVIVFVTTEEPELVQHAHRPCKFRGGGTFQDAMAWTVGNTEDDAHFIVLPDNMFGRTINIVVQTDPATVLAALEAPGAAHDGPHAAGAANTGNVRIRKASLQPVAWARRQVRDGPHTFAQYHAEYIAPVIATGNANAIQDIQPHVNWWSAQATAMPPAAAGGANCHLGQITPTPVAPADRGTLTFGCRRIVFPDMNQVVAPAGPGHLTNAGVNAAIGVLDATLRQHETQRLNREHDAANKSFTDQHGNFKATLMHCMMEAPDDASLPQAHRMLARTENAPARPVRARTVEVALSDVAALFADMDQPDPRCRDGRTHPSLKKWLIAMHKEDPASTSVLPCSLIIIQHLFRMDLEGADVHTHDVIVIAFFFLNRPGEVIKTSSTDKGRSAPFTLGTVALKLPDGRSLSGSASTLKLQSLNDACGTCIHTSCS